MGHGFYSEEFKLVGTKENWRADFFLCVRVVVFFHMEKKIPPCLKRLCMFSPVVNVVVAAYFSFGSTVSSRRSVFLFLFYFFVVYFFSPHLPAYGRRKRAGVTDRKLSGPGNPGEACACGKWAAGGWK